MSRTMQNNSDPKRTAPWAFTLTEHQLVGQVVVPTSVGTFTCLDPVTSKAAGQRPGKIRRASGSPARRGFTCHDLVPGKMAGQRPGKPGQRPALPQNRALVRRAFTLVEMIVAVAILSGLMAMVAMIFSTASKATGQAQTSALIYRQLRQATGIIRKDLEETIPSSDPNATCVMAIAGVQVAAYETPNDLNTRRTLIKDSSDPNNDFHRADVLMLFTKRKIEPYVFEQPDPNNPIPFADTVQVVYGHADIGRLIENPVGSNNWEFSPNSTLVESGAIPASQWHLARRVINFPNQKIIPPFPKGAGPQGSSPILTNKEIMDAQADVFTEPIDYVFADANYPNNIGQGCLCFNNKTDFCRVWYLNNWYGLDLKNNIWYLFYDDHWYRDVTGVWTREEYGLPPYIALAPLPSTPPPSGLPYAPQWFYDPAFNSSNQRKRTLIDPYPPGGQTDKLAFYFLPACSEFKVEFTYDDPREIIIDDDPSSPTFGKVPLFDWDGDGTDDTPVPRPINWRSVPNGQQVVWSRMSLKTGPTDDRTDPHRWPRGLRITIKLYDQASQLKQPITQTIVYAF